MKKMHENTCLQCNTTVSGPTNRLVQDACGHKKCRSCLLEDEEGCSQCETENGLNPKLKTISNECSDNGEACTELVLNNHTGVIQVNGGIPKDKLKEKRLDSISNFTETAAVAGTSKEDDLQEELKSVQVKKQQIASSRSNEVDKIEIKKTIRTPIDIPSHIRIISDPLSYQCTICDKTFVTKTHVKYHSFCNGGIKPYKCEVCQKEFILQAQLAVHSYKHKSSKPFTCTICKKSFSAKNKLTRHSVIHSEIRSHICSMCGNAYRSKESLKIHSIIHKGEKPYSCKLCPAKFNNQSNLNKHVLTHSKEKAHMCDQCGKRFKQKWALSVHRRSHLRVRPHQCAICQKAFVNLKDLQRHNLIHADSKMYSCSICSLSFRRTDNLRRHMKNTHPGKQGEVIKNPVTLPVIQNKKSPLDNPNAINVIMSASATASSKAEGAQAQPPKKVLSLPQSDCRPSPNNTSSPANNLNTNCNKNVNVVSTTVINGPIKLAFKTPAFKSSYNIHRDFDCVPAAQRQNTYDVVESVNIYQKILSGKSSRDSLPSRNIICRAEPREPTSEEICKKILDPNSEPKLHYETSFQNRKHAMIKNIKFKVPIQYTSSFKDSNVSERGTDDNTDSISATSVIVNNNVQSSTVEHWRRRTSQNLSLKN